MENIKTIAIAGAGTMGQGIALVFASAGYKTKLFDIDGQLTDKAIAAMQKYLSVAVEKGKLSNAQRERIEKNIVPCYSLTEVNADIVLEAVVEKLDVKQDLFRELENINPRETLWVTNTSSFQVGNIASALKDPRRCVGLHFFNPAYQMRLVEVIAGKATAPELVALMMELSRKAGKVPVRVKDSPGFIVNRVARHFYTESLKLLEEKVADVPGIDGLLRSAGFKMGPFELMDLIGIDINYAVTRSMHDAFYPDPKFAPSPLQRQKIDEGHLGRKTGKGFYDYAKN